MVQKNDLTGIAKERWVECLKRWPNLFPETLFDHVEINGVYFARCRAVLYDQEEMDAKGDLLIKGAATRSVRIWGDAAGHTLGRLETTAISRACARALGEDDPANGEIDPVEEAMNISDAIKQVKEMFIRDFKEKDIIEWIENNCTDNTKRIVIERFQSLKANKKG